ncbi:hypothetical protein D3C77_400850 [compost metagenome]
MTNQQFKQVPVAVGLLGGDKAFGVLVVNLARLVASVGTHAVAGSVARLQLVGAASGQGLPGMVQELSQLHIIHRRAVFVHVLAAICPLNVVADPLGLVLGHLDLRVIARHGPILKETNITTGTVEPLAQLFGRILELLGRHLGRRIARVFAVQLAHQGKVAGLILEQPQKLALGHIDDVEHAAQSVITDCPSGRLNGLDTALAVTGERQQAVQAFQWLVGKALHVALNAVVGKDGERNALLLEVSLSNKILRGLGRSFGQTVGRRLGLPGRVGLGQLFHVAAHSAFDALDFGLCERPANRLGDGLYTFGAHGLAPEGMEQAYGVEEVGFPTI